LPLRDPNEPDFVRLNPNAQVPVIVDGDFVLWESHPIMRYINDRDGRHLLLPADLQARAVAEQWLQWQATELNPQWGYAVQALIRRIPGYDDPAQLRRSDERWTGTMAILEERIAETGAYAGGRSFSLADIALGLSLHRWYAMPAAEVPVFPVLRAYYERLLEREAGARYMGADVH
jgi:glutathione S-transferase